MIYDVVKYGNPVLAKRADDVAEFDAALRKLVDDMFETMYASRGVGLAAPQIGISKRLFVMDCGLDDQKKTRKIAVANPRIEVEEGSQLQDEGCLSVPGYSFQIKRPERVRVTGQDPDGNQIDFELTGLEARCVSHEVDHLEGKLLTSRVSPLKRNMVEQKIKKKMKRGEW